MNIAWRIARKTAACSVFSHFMITSFIAFATKRITSREETEFLVAGRNNHPHAASFTPQERPRYC